MSAELVIAAYIARIETALTEIATHFATDLTNAQGPAGSTGPIR